MDFLDKDEIVLEKKRLVPSFRNNGNIIHDLFAEKIMKSSKYKRISFWVRRLAHRSRYIFRETINQLEKDHIVRRELRKFLNIIPYYKYWFFDKSIRINLIEDLRNILLHGKQANKKQTMLLGLISAARAHSLLAREKGERKLLRGKTHEFLKGDIMSAEINQAIREVHAAIVASITAASAASHGAQ
jgi:hypothetical protein